MFRATIQGEQQSSTSLSLTATMVLDFHVPCGRHRHGFNSVVDVHFAQDEYNQTYIVECVEEFSTALDISIDLDSVRSTSYIPGIR